MLVDTHCHVLDEYYDDIDAVIARAKDAGVGMIIVNGIDSKSNEEVLKLVSKYDIVYGALGIQPESIMNVTDDDFRFIEEHIHDDKILAIGEIGLDYYYTKENKKEQIEILCKQLELAEKLNLPVIIHSREATGDMLSILKKFNVKGVIHCFNGSVEVAKEYIKLGYKLGINGVITFKNCKLIDVIKTIGVDNVVFETDSPYLAPVPFRGEENNPTHVIDIVDFVSNNTGVSVEDLANISNKNIKDIFDI